MVDRVVAERVAAETNDEPLDKKVFALALFAAVHKQRAAMQKEDVGMKAWLRKELDLFTQGFSAHHRRHLNP